MRKYLLLCFPFVVATTLYSCKGCGGAKQPAAPPAPVNTPPVKTAQIDSITKLIDAQPNNAVLYYARCKEYIKTNSLDAAMRDIVKAIGIDPKNPQYYLTQSDIYFLQKDIVRSINALEQGNTVAPDNIEILLPLARYYFYKCDYVKALPAVNHVLKMDPSNADAYFLRAQVFEETKDTDKAISDLKSVIEHSPKYYDAYMELGVIMAARKDKLALDYYNNALKLDSNSVEAKYGIAMYYQDKKDYPKAIELYRKLAIDTPQYERPYYNLGYIYFQMDSLQKADRNFEIATSVKPQYADAYYMRGLIAEEKGDDKQAGYFYDQTLKLDPANPGAIKGMGRLRNERKK